jgi:hypothetical protein
MLRIKIVKFGNNWQIKIRRFLIGKQLRDPPEKTSFDLKVRERSSTNSSLSRDIEDFLKTFGWAIVVIIVLLLLQYNGYFNGDFNNRRNRRFD